MTRNVWTHTLIILLAIAAIFFIGERTMELLQAFSNVILIFFMAWLIAFLLSPAADALERRRLPRGLAVLTVYASLILLLVIIGGILTPILIDQGQELEQQIPEDLNQVLAFVNQIDSELGRWGIPIDLNTMFDAKTILEQVQQWGSVVLQNTMNVVTRVTSVV
ncbi:MAG: AI-2E family transporter, partial [Chloroflexi bacterium]|nr:AI-2E family transporter [Chloroflexota bacterium]